VTEQLGGGLAATQGQPTTAYFLLLPSKFAVITTIISERNPIEKHFNTILSILRFIK